MKKKFLALLLAAICLCGLGCSADSETSKAVSSPAQSGGKGKSYRLGYAFLPQKTGDKVEFSATFCAIITDEGGKIVACKIDELEAEPDTDDIEDEIGTRIETKLMLGDKYGMKNYSPIKKEWYEQAEAFCNYCIGKTPEQVTASVGVDGKVEDLKASCTVNASNFAQGVSKAYENRGKEFKYTEAPGLGISVICTVESDSRESDDGLSGKAILGCVMSAAATDKSGTVLACFADEAEITLEFDEHGNIINGTGKLPQSKRELGDGYGMKSASGIKKEWYEQAIALCEYCVGKTEKDLTASLSADGKIADLKASCTVNVSQLIKGIGECIKGSQ